MTIRQLRMLDEIVRSRGVSYEKALELNQNVFGSLCYRKWLSWDVDRERFYVNGDGMEVRSKINSWELHRLVNNHKIALRAQPVLRYRADRYRGLKRIA